MSLLVHRRLGLYQGIQDVMYSFEHLCRVCGGGKLVDRGVTCSQVDGWRRQANKLLTTNRQRVPMRRFAIAQKMICPCKIVV